MENILFQAKTFTMNEDGIKFNNDEKLKISEILNINSERVKTIFSKKVLLFIFSLGVLY